MVIIVYVLPSNGGANEFWAGNHTINIQVAEVYSHMNITYSTETYGNLSKNHGRGAAQWISPVSIG